MYAFGSSVYRTWRVNWAHPANTNVNHSNLSNTTSSSSSSWTEPNSQTKNKHNSATHKRMLMHLIATPLHFISFDIVSCWRCCCTLYMDVVRANRQHSLRIQMPVLKPATTFNHIGWTLTYISIATMDVWFFAVLCYAVQCCTVSESVRTKHRRYCHV